MPIAKINNSEVYYEIHGDGSPLLLIAGLASDSQSWLPVIPELSKNHQVIVYDNRGVGRTKPMDEPISISQMTDDCIGLINYLGLSRLNLLGHSMGGMVALDVAKRNSEIVSNLILVATSSVISARNANLFNDWVKNLEHGMSPELWYRNMFYWIFSKKFFENEDVLETAVQMAIDYPYPQSEIAFANQIEAIRSFNSTTDLTSVKTNTLVIGGEEDILFTADEVYNNLKNIKGAKFSIIEGAAHSVFMEKPMEFVKVLNDYLLNI